MLHGAGEQDAGSSACGLLRLFRTNGAIVKGFERDVGSRTTHYTFSTNTLMNSLRSYAGFRGPPQSTVRSDVSFTFHFFNTFLWVFLPVYKHSFSISDLVCYLVVLL